MGAGATPLAAGAANLPVSSTGHGSPIESVVPVESIYLDSGTMHPIPVGVRSALEAYYATRSAGTDWPSHDVERRIKANFGRLVGADPDELALVQSTTAGEQLVIDALGIPATGGSIVTDTLHFFGSFWLYEQLGKRGMDVRWLRPVAGRISVDQYERAIGPDTRLVSLSLVSTYNGFEHDLARVCEVAHRHGAKVYADIIHAAGTVPLNLHATGVDFAAAATYKWLMGDFGLGFLYVRRDLLGELERPRFGYYQLGSFRPHAYPFDTPGDTIADMTARDDAEGLFAMGTRSHSVMAQLDWSLNYLLKLGVENITTQRMPWLQRLHHSLPAKGYTVVTPPECRSPLFTCVLENAHARLRKPLADAGVQVTLSRNRFRVCTSFFNSDDDIERLVDALPSI